MYGFTLLAIRTQSVNILFQYDLLCSLCSHALGFLLVTFDSQYSYVLSVLDKWLFTYSAIDVAYMLLNCVCLQDMSDVPAMALANDAGMSQDQIKESALI